MRGTRGTTPTTPFATSISLERGNRPEAQALLIFSPDGFRAEAMAAAAAAMAFSIDERTRLFRDVLFPSAGLDPAEADTYAEICGLMDRLTEATTPTLRAYLSGELTAAAAAAALERDSLMEHPDGLLAYADRYRAYTLAYTWGRDRLLATLTEPALGVEDRWRLLQHYMTSPRHQEDLFAARQANNRCAEALRAPKDRAKIPPWSERLSSSSPCSRACGPQE